VLWQHAGLTFSDIAALTVDDVRIEDGLASIRGVDGTEITLRMTQDGLLCGPCALVRWMHALDLSTLHSDGRVVASVIARAVPLTAHSPHVCEGRTAGAQDTSGLRIFPEHDRWAPGPDSRARPAHDRPPPAPGPRYGAGTQAGADHALTDRVPSPVDHPTALENRARALMAGSA
jgi:hypothetical protein